MFSNKYTLLFSAVVLLFSLSPGKIFAQTEPTGCCILDTTKISADNCSQNSTQNSCQGSNSFFLNGDPSCSGDISKSYCSNSTQDDIGCCVKNVTDSSKFGPDNCQVNTKKSNCASPSVIDVTDPECKNLSACKSSGTSTTTDPGENNSSSCSKSPEEGIGTGGFLLYKGSIVPCGRQCDDSNTSNDESADCTLCHLIIMLYNIFRLLISLLIIVALVFVTISGTIYIISSGNPGLKGIAKNILTKTLTGFAITLLSWLVVFTVLKFISARTEVLGDGSKWYEFDCDTTSAFEEGKEETEEKEEGEESTPTPSGYTYDSGIESQTSDASSALNSLLSCMQPKLSDSAKRISSISDSAGMSACQSSNWNDSKCAHTQNSCHYGGTNCIGKSYAVDFGNENAYSEINSAAKSCASSSYVLKEDDHVHVSIGSANGCGCDK